MAEYGNGTKKFMNPYNFISLGKTPSRLINAEETSAVEMHTGILDCQILTKTPLAIPDMVSFKRMEDEKVKEHFHTPFFSIDGKYCIPASSIRGPIRSVYETLTNSCMVSLEEDEFITKRSDLGTFAPCVIKKENEEWHLYDAKRVAIIGGSGSRPRYAKNDKFINSNKYVKFDVFSDKDGKKYIKDNQNNNVYWGDSVVINTQKPGHEKRMRNGNLREVWGDKHLSQIQKDNKSNSYLYLGEMINGKHAESVFQVTTLNKEIKHNDITNALKKMESTLEMYRNASINKNLGTSHLGYRGYEQAKDNGAIPLWYQVDNNNHLYLSLASIGRISYYTSLKDLSNQHNQCVSRKRVCPACSLFGMVGKGKNIDGKVNDGIGSKIRFTDAFLVDNNGQNVLQKNVTLKELGGPRTSYLPFYSQGGKKYDEPGAKIRGRKYYWHIPEAAVKSAIYSDSRKTKRNDTMDLIMPGNIFKFKVYYNQLSKEELEMLIWSLTLGSNDNNLMHKIGHGKPLGLGSVKITVNNKTERIFDEDYIIRSENVNINTPDIMDKSSWEELEIMAEFKVGSKEKICYPFVEPSNQVQGIIDAQKKAGYEINDNVLASHQWFGHNTVKLPEVTEAKSKMFNNQMVTRVKEPGIDNYGNFKTGDFKKPKGQR